VKRSAQIFHLDVHQIAHTFDEIRDSPHGLPLSLGFQDVVVALRVDIRPRLSYPQITVNHLDKQHAHDSFKVN